MQKWAEQSQFKRDFQGRVKGLGYNNVHTHAAASGCKYRRSYRLDVSFYAGDAGRHP